MSLTCVGALAGSYGVRGEVRLKSFCAVAEDVANYGPLVTEDGRIFEVELGAPLKGGFAARLAGISTKEEADALRGVRLHVPRDRLPEPEDDEFYHVDLIGLDAVDPGGVVIGRVTAVLEQGPGDLLELSLPGRGEPVLVPFTRLIVPNVDLRRRRLVIDPPEGLLDD